MSPRLDSYAISEPDKWLRCTASFDDGQFIVSSIPLHQIMPLPHNQMFSTTKTYAYNTVQNILKNTEDLITNNNFKSYQQQTWKNLYVLVQATNFWLEA